jgi:hypothetical protein
VRRRRLPSELDIACFGLDANFMQDFKLFRAELADTILLICISSLEKKYSR